MKGVGDYTAAAICSFAYDMPYAAVDGNVYRVLSRYFGIDVPIDSTEGKKTFTALAGEVLDKSRPADYNQAIMDFGAVQCTPQSPNCLFCPLSGSCRALSEGKVQQLPVKQHRTKTTNRYFNYIYVRMGAHTLIHKRTEDDIWKISLNCLWLKRKKIYPKRNFWHVRSFMRCLQRERCGWSVHCFGG